MKKLLALLVGLALSVSLYAYGAINPAAETKVIEVPVGTQNLVDWYVDHTHGEDYYSVVQYTKGSQHGSDSMVHYEVWNKGVLEAECITSREYMELVYIEEHQ